jgi:hypothetical protein
LYILYLEYKDEATMPVRARLAALQCVFLVIYYNGLAGRPMEWATLLKKDAFDQLEKHPDHLVMKTFKTKKVYGWVGKAISEGTLECIKIFSKLPTVDGSESELLFPVTPDTHKQTWKTKERSGEHFVGVNDVLGEAVKKYLPGYPLMGPTLLRKQITTKTKNDDVSFDWKVLAMLDTHSEEVAESNYNLSEVRPQEIARQGRRLFLKYMGDAVGFPTAQEVECVNRTAEQISRKMYRCAQADQAAGDQGSEAGLNTPPPLQRKPARLSTSKQERPAAATGSQKFNDDQLEWVVGEHARLPCHGLGLPLHLRGEVTGPAGKKDMMKLVRKGLLLDKLPKNYINEEKLFEAVRHIIRSHLKRQDAPPRSLERQFTRASTPTPSKSTGMKRVCRAVAPGLVASQQPLPRSSTSPRSAWIGSPPGASCQKVQAPTTTTITRSSTPSGSASAGPFAGASSSAVPVTSPPMSGASARSSSASAGPVANKSSATVPVATPPPIKKNRRY